jgi:hypothetical protein
LSDNAKTFAAACGGKANLHKAPAVVPKIFTRFFQKIVEKSHILD